MLMTAAQMGLPSAAQQLLLINPRAGWDHGTDTLIPAFLAASSPHGAAVLQLLLAAAPERVHTTCRGRANWTGWTLMNAAARSGNVAARSGNVAAIRLLLQLAPELAAAATSFQHTPLHEAAGSGSPEAVRLLLEAAPQTAAAADSKQALPIHWAAKAGCVECLSALLDAGAPGLGTPTEVGELPLHCAAASGSVDCIQFLLDAGAPGLDAPSEVGELPLHLAASWDHVAAVRCLMAAHPAAALAQDNQGQRPLHLALLYTPWLEPRIAANAARALLPVSGLSAQQLLDSLAAVPAEARPLVQPLYVELAANLPLSPEQWDRMPTPCPSLGSALPAVLSRSEPEAALLLARLPFSRIQRLRTAALSLHRQQRTLELDVPVPTALLGRILALSVSDA